MMAVSMNRLVQNRQLPASTSGDDMIAADNPNHCSAKLTTILNQAGFNAILKESVQFTFQANSFYFDVFKVERSTKFGFVFTGRNFNHCRLAIFNEYAETIWRKCMGA
jgi:hypothetical protein